MRHYVNRHLMTVLILIFGLQASGCGTILYPERRNQRAGRIDVGVALLDGFWLLVGIIPGVIAFAVDFSTGAIYIPEHGLAERESSEYRVVHYDPNEMTKKDIEALISLEIGEEFRFSDDRYRMSRLNDKDEWDQYISNRF